MNKLGRVYYLVIGVIVCNIILSAYWLLLGDIRYDVDISRDFLLMEEMIFVKPSLIGSHTSIGGVFHGPAWYYLNLPAFFIGGGDPLMIGWFWWFLSIMTIIIFFLIAKKMFNKQIALLAILLYSANAIINPIYGLKMFFPPFGAMVLFPIFFYLFRQYILEKKIKYLVFAILTLGFIIQFEMAFGIPILGLTILFLAFFLIKKRLLKHWLSFLIILLPLSTFIIFDFKHNFLQINSIFNYLSFQLNKNTFNFTDFIIGKFTGIFSDTFYLLTQDNRILSWVCSILFVFLVFKIAMKPKDKKTYLLFIYFYFGYWLVHLSLKPLWSSYYWPLLPVIIMLYVGLKNYLSRKAFLLIFLPLLFWNMFIGISYIHNFKIDVTERGKNSWAFNRYVAENVFNNSSDDFGYFIFTPERWVYQQWYALKYVQKKYPDRIAFPFEKKELTYLIIVDSPANDLDPVSMGWRITDLKINQEPKEKRRIDIVEIQKYHLTDKEIKSEINPYLLNSTFFR